MVLGNRTGIVIQIVLVGVDIQCGFLKIWILRCLSGFMVVSLRIMGWKEERDGKTFRLMVSDKLENEMITKKYAYRGWVENLVYLFEVLGSFDIILDVK